MRIVVVGTSGAGKTLFARELAAATGMPHVELDELHWLPRWRARPRAEFRALVEDATAGRHWVVDGNYSGVRDVMWARATDVVWLDYGRLTVWSRILRRTLLRALRGDVVCAGNRESFRQSFLSRDSVVLWSLKTFDRNRRRYESLQASDNWPSLNWHVLKRPADARAFIDAQRLHARALQRQAPGRPVVR